MSDKHLYTLEYNRILEMLSGCAVCNDAKALALKVRPVTRFSKAVNELAFTSCANSLSTKFSYPTIYKMNNCAIPLKRGSMGGMLSLRELLDISVVLQTMRSLDSWRKQIEDKTELDDFFETLYLNRELEQRLKSSIISEEDLDDNASSELSSIRRKIRNAGLKVRAQLDAMIRSTTFQKYLQEPIVTMRDGRFVVPVKAEYKNEVKGLVHDTSSSGASFFIEPLAVVELNNEIKILESQEKKEIERIIAELSALVGEHCEETTYGYDSAIMLDLYFAKSHLADRMHALVPKLTDTGFTQLRKARHPLIPREKAVPIDISVGGDYDTLVITGPNTGGKTVAIKTLGLLVLMGMSGFLLPVSSASEVSIYTNVLADIGDEQSIEQNLSTFSSHMTNIIDILSTVDENSLVLLDELGAGTDPVEGAALAVAIIEELRGKGAKIAATTHYPEIKMYALDTVGVENASCEFDVASLRPTYKLLTGIPGRSNAFLISEKLGLNTKVIDRAKVFVSTDNTRFEDVVAELEATRQQLEKQKIEAQHLKDQAKSIYDQAQKEYDRFQKDKENELIQARHQAKRIIEDTRASAQILIEQLEDVKKEKDADAFSKLLLGSRQSFKDTIKELEDIADPVNINKSNAKELSRPLEKGDIVYIYTLAKEGIVLKKPEGTTVYIQAGTIKTSVPITEITLDLPKKEAKKEKGRVSTRGVSSNASKEVLLELNLRGMDAIEAVSALEDFIDRALLQKIPSIRIIHGKGTGVLRQAVQRRLSSHKAIDSYRLGVYGEGESGVTIATLK